MYGGVEALAGMYYYALKDTSYNELEFHLARVKDSMKCVLQT